ncbi:MAG: hypothetical protein IPP49_05810 [Saprospiraceae bacterium]|nr:hypothetical protein [Saprospiraceae bacterium]
MPNVSGKAAKENNEEIQNVTVEMKGSEQNPELTNVDGRFAFAPMPVGGNYDIVPSKDGDDMNGVSTLDIVMIQRHILGIEKLKSPYLMIAADANNSGSVTASDLTELRKLVLGLLPSLPNNTSWRLSWRLQITRSMAIRVSGRLKDWSSGTYVKQVCRLKQVNMY